MEERDIERILAQGFTLPPASVRDALLERCLAVIAEDDEGKELDDDQLEMLAAAGDINALYGDQ